jgi:hypothetical protein
MIWMSFVQLVQLKPSIIPSNSDGIASPNYNYDDSRQSSSIAKRNTAFIALNLFT